MNISEGMNPRQMEAVEYTEGPAADSGRRRFRKDQGTDAQDCIFNRRKAGAALSDHGDHLYQ